MNTIENIDNEYMLLLCLSRVDVEERGRWPEYHGLCLSEMDLESVLPGFEHLGL